MLLQTPFLRPSPITTTFHFLCKSKVDGSPSTYLSLEAHNLGREAFGITQRLFFSLGPYLFSS